MPARPDAYEHAGLAVTAWQRLRPVAADPDWRAVGAMVAHVHQLDPAELPVDYPCPPCTSFPWWRFDELLAELGPLIDEPARSGLVAAVDRYRGWEAIGPWTVCHGDVHPGNVVATAAGPVLLDWDLLCTGPPAWDHAMLLRLERWGWPPAWYDAFAAGYGRSLAGDPVACALAELRLVAATLMRVARRARRPGGEAGSGSAPRPLARRARRRHVERGVTLPGADRREPPRCRHGSQPADRVPHP